MSVTEPRPAPLTPAEDAALWETLGRVNIREILKTQSEPDFVVDPFIVKGVVNSIVGAAESGKSWLALQMALAKALGKPMFGSPAEKPISVLYLDYENNEADLRQRIPELGYGAEDDFSNLHYFVQPDIAQLDTPQGGLDFATLLKEFAPELVIIDTLARCLSGSENEADTFNALSRNTLALMRGHVTVVLLDHFGHEDDHARGSSAKRQLWNTEFHVKRTSGNTTDVTCSKDRRGWLPKKATLEWCDGYFDLRVAQPEPAVMEVVNKLNAFRVPLTLSREGVRKFFAECGETVGAGNAKLDAAIAYRKRARPHGARTAEAGEE